MKVSELTGALLDYWVARAENLQVDFRTSRHRPTEYRPPNDEDRPVVAYVTEHGWAAYPEGFPQVYAPSTAWANGGPIIERDQIFLDAPHTVHRDNYNPDGTLKGVWETYESWHATVSARTRTWSTGPDDPALIAGGRVGRGEGPTPLIAAMRAKVASHYGDEVPDEIGT